MDRAYIDLKETLCKLLKEMAKTKSPDKSDIDAIEKLTNSILNIKAIMADDEEEEYSHARGGMWAANGSYGANNGRGYMHSYDDGMYNDNSYANRRGMHYVKGHYSHADNVEGEIRRMMDESNISSSDKMILEKALEIVRR